MEKAISLNPARRRVTTSSAYIYLDQEAYPQAYMFFDMAAQRDSEAPEYVYMRGMSNFRMEKYADAIPDLNKAISTDARPTTLLLEPGAFACGIWIDSLNAAQAYSRIHSPEARRTERVFGAGGSL